ncbi:MAG: type II toxin-antitoxin system Phd/YefM family antitoxin [Verrucomicrobia bacterium]|nr:type II toxin-antitoxin system Phd/YefM family antitoxin [Verrucomicrobiota bacterium]
MITIPFTEFRRNASGLLDRVEKGEALLVLRHGRPVAEITPVTENDKSTPSWKRPGVKLVTKGGQLSTAIIEERSREDIL